MNNEEEILSLLREGKQERAEMREEIKSLTRAIHNASVRGKRVEHKLVGDKEMEIPGLISEVEELKKFKRKEELNKAKQRGIIAGIAMAGGAFGTWLKQLFGA